MKVIKFYTVWMALGAILFFSCQKSEVGPNNTATQKTMTELQPDADFSWATERIVEIKLLANASGVVYVRPVEGDFYFFKGFLTAGKPFTAKIAIPAYMTKVKLTFSGSVHEIMVTGDHLDFTF